MKHNHVHVETRSRTRYYAANKTRPANLNRFITSRTIKTRNGTEQQTPTPSGSAARQLSNQQLELTAEVN